MLFNGIFLGKLRPASSMNASQDSNESEMTGAYCSCLQHALRVWVLQKFCPRGTFWRVEPTLRLDLESSHYPAGNLHELPSGLCKHKTHLSKVLWERSCFVAGKQLCIATVINFWKMFKRAPLSGFNTTVYPPAFLSVTFFLCRSRGNQDQ